MNFPHLSASTPVERQRHYLGVIMDLLVAHKAKVPYDHHGVRPQTTRHILNETQLIAALQTRNGLPPCDCTETIDLVFRVAGLGDPSGLGWERGLGWTGSMLAHLPSYEDAHKALLGAIVIFGPGKGDHGGIVRRPGADPLLFSHGGDSGPSYLRLSVERAYHKPPVRFLNIQSLFAHA